MKACAGWRGSIKGARIPQWRIQARKATSTAKAKAFGIGGLPLQRKARAAPSMPKLSCLDQEDGR